MCVETKGVREKGPLGKGAGGEKRLEEEKQSSREKCLPIDQAISTIDSWIVRVFSVRWRGPVRLIEFPVFLGRLEQDLELSLELCLVVNLVSNCGIHILPPEARRLSQAGNEVIVS